MPYSIFGCTFGWQVKLCDLLLIHVIPEYFRDEYCSQYKLLPVCKCPVYFTLLYFVSKTVTVPWTVNAFNIFSVNGMHMFKNMWEQNQIRYMIQYG